MSGAASRPRRRRGFEGEGGEKPEGEKGKGDKEPKDGSGDEGDKDKDGKKGKEKNDTDGDGGEDPNESPEDRARRILKDNADLETGPLSPGRREFRDAKKDW